MAMSGHISMACGKASYSYEKIPEPPKPKDTRYEIRVHQEIEHDNSFVEWEVWGAHNKAHISGPDRGNIIFGPTYRMRMDVDNPTTIKDTNVRFTYIDGRSDIMMTTGTMRKKYNDALPTIQMMRKGGWPNHCYGVWTRWYPKGEGHFRDFNCFFNDVPCASDPAECKEAFMEAGWTEGDLGWLKESWSGEAEVEPRAGNQNI
jgi:hypothetical protein